MTRMNRSTTVLTAAFAVASALAFTAPAAAAAGEHSRTIEITVTDRGYEPGRIELVAGEPMRLAFSNRASSACAASVESEALGIERTELPRGKTTVVVAVPEQAGEFTFACGMGMLAGTVVVETAASAEGNEP